MAFIRGAKCDVCGTTASFIESEAVRGFMNKGNVRHHLRKEGWAFSGASNAKCPNCRKGKNHGKA